MTSADISGWLGEASFVLTLVILLILLARVVLRRILGAAWTYALWLAVPLALLATLAPVRMVELPIGPPGPPAAIMNVSRKAANPPAIETPIAAPAARQTSAAAPAPVLTGGKAAFALWLAGTAVFLLTFALAHWRFRRFVAGGARSPAPDEARDLDATAAGTPFVAERDFRFSTRVTSPVLYGLVRPIVLLPDTFLADYSPVERRAILLHEAAHARAGHVAHRLAARILRAIFWFNPLVWLAERAFAWDQELVCDEAVLARDAGVGPKLYASTLLKAAQLLGGAKMYAPAPAAPLLSARHLARRIRILARGAAPRRAGATGALTVAAVASAATLTACSSIVPADTLMLRAMAAQAAGGEDEAEDLLDIQPGVTRRADIEAFAGEPEYFMPSRNVAVYSAGRGGGPAVIFSCRLRTLYAIRYEDDVVHGFWEGVSNDFITDSSGEWYHTLWQAPDRPLLDVIHAGVSRRADVETLLGEPFYVLPGLDDVAVYLRPEPKNDEAAPDACGSGADEAPCAGDRVVVTGERRPGCSLTINPPSFRKRRIIVQYDDNGVVARAESLLFPREYFRLDEWAAGGANTDGSGS